MDHETIDPLLSPDARSSSTRSGGRDSAPAVGLAFGWRHRRVAAVVLAVALLIGGEAVVAGRSRVAPNVTLAGQPVGRLSRPELVTRVQAIAATFPSTPVIVRSDTGEIRSTAGDLGIGVDVEATVSAAWDANRASVPLLGWIWTASRSRNIGVELAAEDWRGDAVLGMGPVAADAQLGVRDGALVALPGAPALGIDPEAVRRQLDDATWFAGSLEITAPVVTAMPRRTTDQVQALADMLNQATAQPLAVTAVGVTATVPPERVRSWIRLADTPTGFTLDPAAVDEDLDAAFAGYRSEPVDARFDVVGGVPVIVGGTEGVSCCDATAVEPLVAALATGGPPGAVAVPVETTLPGTTAASLEALGVREAVGTFTTEFPCCQHRVKNIERMAELLRGQLIRPGELFSVNERIGPRTADNGFVPAPAIVGGEIGEEVAGGISQVMTTLFNAAFFAGLDYGQYQSHSLYFSKYPYGREATINWPKPDLQIENTTPYGVLVWAEVTDTSITVSMYSTRVYSSVEQTGQTEEPAGVSCTLVRTERTRLGLDGTSQTDEVRALYRREAGLNCDQDEKPTTTTSTAASVAATTTVLPEVTASDPDHEHPPVSSDDPGATTPPTGTSPSTTAPAPDATGAG